MHKNNDQKLSQNILSMLIAVGNTKGARRVFGSSYIFYITIILYYNIEYMG